MYINEICHMRCQRDKDEIFFLNQFRSTMKNKAYIVVSFQMELFYFDLLNVLCYICSVFIIKKKKKTTLKLSETEHNKFP